MHLFQNQIDIGKQVDAKDMFDAMLNSAYMKKRGYTLLYHNPQYDNDKKTKKVSGITITKTTKGKVVGYSLCFNHSNEMIYLHFRFLTGQITSFTYELMLGDANTADADLIELCKELKNNL